MLTQSAASLEYVRVPISASINGVTTNPTSDTVKMAFMAGTPTGALNPGVSDWQNAAWETAGVVYYAICLVGPAGTVTLTAGEYQVWIKITDSPEIPVRHVGSVTIT